MQLEVDDDTPEVGGNTLSQTAPIKRGHSAETRAILRANEYSIDVVKLGLDLHDDGPREGLPRVQKKIRMRVRYKCHQCEANFTQGKTCRKCSHERCRECPRDPVKKNKERSDQFHTRESRESISAENQPDLPGPSYAKQSQIKFPQSSGQGQSRIIQRLQYACHECETLFVAGTAQHCPNCGHRRCESCPRQLACSSLATEAPTEPILTTSELSERKPSSRVWRRTRQRVKWVCHECQHPFKQGNLSCSYCKHTRCSSCLRKP